MKTTQPPNTAQKAVIHIHCEPSRKSRYNRALKTFYKTGTKLSDVINPIVFEALDEWADGILGTDQ
jgi:hypothetical protein